MRYQNAAELLPAELLEALQGYLDGGYLYIPRRAEHRRAWGERTRRKEETLARNRAIFRDYTAGLGVDELSARYFLAPKSIQRILTLGRRACWSHSPAPERSTLRRSFFAVPSLRLPPHGPLCYNGRESEARYP